jgi:NTP pyrophosphatase (non-canonical NTP hydrolase)
MKDEDLLKIINHYGVMKQLKYFQTEVFELNEAIINTEYLPFHNEKDKDHIAEEIADVMVMLSQFKEYYGIDGNQIMDIMKYKVERQLERIQLENSNAKKGI